MTNTEKELQEILNRLAIERGAIMGQVVSLQVEWKVGEPASIDHIAFIPQREMSPAIAPRTIVK